KWRISAEDFEKLLNLYYEIRGWNKEGIPTEDTIKNLDLKI
ncbi:MAG: hypothetical protein H5T34_00760, partial [Candidatus Methanomethyliales bacterium]|nr:hypothetical protein [Candidatus Methanomethylicales archaeon]